MVTKRTTFKAIDYWTKDLNPNVYTILEPVEYANETEQGRKGYPLHYNKYGGFKSIVDARKKAYSLVNSRRGWHHVYIYKGTLEVGNVTNLYRQSHGIVYKSYTKPIDKGFAIFIKDTYYTLNKDGTIKGRF